MQGRDFLKPARTLVAGSSEAYWRGASVHAYYSLFLECREALARWARLPAGRHNIHHVVRLKFAYATSPELKQIGTVLEDLGLLRGRASYDLGNLPDFASFTDANDAISNASAALAMLDAIESDPQRRAAAIGSLPQ